MELPKRARTADWESGVLILDGEKKYEVPKLTMELMERAPEKLIRASMAPVRRASMAPVRRAGIGPMLVGRGLEEINWEPVKLNDLHVVHKRTDRSEFDTKG